MNYWNQAPLFRLLPAFISGITAAVLGWHLPHLLLDVTAVVTATGIFMQVVFQKKFYRYSVRWIFGTAAHLLVFSIAFLLTHLKTEINNTDHFSKSPDVILFSAILDDSKQEKAKSFKVTIKVKAVFNGQSWRPVNGKCLAYLSKDSASKNLNYGDEIVFRSRPVEVPPPGNPSQFNYKQWLAYNQVFHQVIISSDDWQLTGHHRGNSLVEAAIDLREKLLRVFRENNMAGEDYAVTAALLLGDTGEIDQEIMNAYAASGTLHVLSVSGMHVGIIYIALSGILFFMDRNKKLKMLKAAILVLFLWFYALLTGLSPAVLRSAAMLSFVVIGRSIERQTNMYNTLAASALALLCYDPYLLMQVGFQLSYLAVLGIVFLYEKIHRLFFPSGWLWKQLWSLTAVSLAAQLATFPVSIFYFQQFPNYFLVANWVVIPLSTVIIYGGILVFLFAPFHWIAGWLGMILGKTVHLLNATVLFIEHLPYSQLTGISVSVFQTYLLYFLLLMLALFLMKKKRSYLLGFLGSCSVFLFSEIADSFHSKKQKQFMVCDIPKAAAINFIERRAGILLADSSLINNPGQVKFNLVHYWWDCGVSEKNIITLNTKEIFKAGKHFLKAGGFIQFRETKILLPGDRDNLIEKKFPLHLDYIVLSSRTGMKLKQLKERFNFGMLILDSSLSLKRAERLETEAHALGIPCYSVVKRGAFITEVN